MRWAVLVFLGACSYGVLSTFVKLAYHAGFTVQEVVGSQAFFGILLLWPMSWFFPRNKLTRKELISIMLVGSTIGLTAIIYYGSLQYLPASVSVVLLFQFTWIGVLIESLIDRQKPDRAKILSLILLFAGTILAAGLLEADTAHWTGIGILLGLLSALSYALFVIFSGRTANHVHPVVRSSIMAFSSLILVFIVFPPFFLWNGSLYAGLALWGFLLALFGIVIPTLFLTLGVPHTGGSLASILGAAELPTAVLMSSMVLGESVSSLQWLGVFVILSGIALPELSGMRREPENKRNRHATTKK
ncbi:EamA family transporter [Ferviditalea candida]|uniref:DMT family transporter n=1 Tax=Ferviditalea candida TaxID=3108399 RepID=A0ABU5ZMI9_9BACL|nr:DMT family transporter [Paenibacillaceae bacterium T2]